MSISYTLPDMADELPAITLSSDFELHYGENASFSSLPIFDERYERIHNNITLDAIRDLPAGTYYISVVVKVQGEYIPDAGCRKTTGSEFVFKMSIL